MLSESMPPTAGPNRLTDRVAGFVRQWSTLDTHAVRAVRMSSVERVASSERAARARRLSSIMRVIDAPISARSPLLVAALARPAPHPPAGRLAVLDAEFGRLLRQLLHELVPLEQHFLLLRQFLQLQVDVAGLRELP